MKFRQTLPKYLAELLGTFWLVFAGTGAIIVDAVSGGKVTHVGVSLVFGLIVLAMIYTIGHISGAHLNPAVTIGFVAAGRLPMKDAFPYVTAQTVGAAAASFLLSRLFSGFPASLGATFPLGSWAQSFGLEWAMTMLLMFVIMGVATDDRAQRSMAGITIGCVIALEALLGGPISGASMNPARSFGPALVAGNFTYHWIYWVAPIAGSLSGVAAYRAIHHVNSGEI